MITKKTCWIQIVAVIGIRIKGELTGVRNLFLTPDLNFEGERPRLEPFPFYSYYLRIRKLRSNHKPQVCFIIFLFLILCLCTKEQGLVDKQAPVPS